MNVDLDEFVGRTSVFIDGGDACLGIVDSVQNADGRITACFRVVPDSFRCRLRLICDLPDDNPIECVMDEPPFGDSWDISVSDQEFHSDHDHWQATFLFGGGFRVFFHNEYVSRFHAGDVRWLGEYYNGDDAES